MDFFIGFMGPATVFVLGWFKTPPVTVKKRLFRQADGQYLLGDDSVLAPNFCPSTLRDQVGDPCSVEIEPRFHTHSSLSRLGRATKDLVFTHTKASPFRAT